VQQRISADLQEAFFGSLSVLLVRCVLLVVVVLQLESVLVGLVLQLELALVGLEQQLETQAEVADPHTE
jgi:hypothetical protein